VVDETGGGGWQLLLSALKSLPIPGSTPERSTRERLGLNLISSSLRLEHVERVTERLGLVDATHMSREIDVDIDLGLLSEEKRDELTFHTVRPSQQAFLWIPVARHPRSSLGPIGLTDGTGALITRVSSTETNRLLASGAIRLLAMLAQSSPDDRSRQDYTSDRLARWLLQAALITLVQEGRQDHATAVREEEALKVRARAEAILRGILQVGHAEPRHTFLDLVQMLTRDQVVVAEFPPDLGRTRVSYRAPELRATPRPRLSWLTDRPGEFRFRYDTRVPGDVDSFHVRLEVPGELEIRRFVVVSEADQRAALVLRADVGRLRHHVDPRTTGPALVGMRLPDPALLSYELRSIRSRLAELARRRADDLRRYDSYVKQAPGPDHTSADQLNLRRLLASDKPFVEAASRLGVEDPTGGRRDSDLDLPELSELLHELERRMDDVDLGLDLGTDNDPSETAGHVQWRRQASGLEAPRDPSVQATVLVTLNDAGPSHARQIVALLAGNVVLVLALLAALWWADVRGNDTRADGNEVTVTLLLLVPGVLISRLTSSTRRTILSTLLAVPQWLAYASMLANLALAILLVAHGGGVFWGLLLPVTALLILLGLSIAHAYREQAATRVKVPNDAGLPGWLLDTDWRRTRRRPSRPRWSRRAGQAGVTRRTRQPTVEFLTELPRAGDRRSGKPLGGGRSGRAGHQVPRTADRR
jgi:hypothetical protein